MIAVEKWGMLEMEAEGFTTGNPFTDYTVQGVFTGKNETVTVDGFYDGDGVYKVRFMPSFEGDYTYEISGSFSDPIKPGVFLPDLSLDIIQFFLFPRQLQRLFLLTHI